MDQEKIRSFFSNDHYAAMTGIKIDDISEDSVTCTLEIRPCHINAGATVQGGVIFTLADFAFGIASNAKAISDGDRTISVGQSNHITFFHPARESHLIAKTQCLQKGRRISVYRVIITDEMGTQIAEMIGNAYCVQK